MTDHLIRRATTADYDAVMAIGDVLFGVDYLQHRYHSFLDDPNAASYVYVIGAEIVGFCTACLVDDGMSLLLRGSRVKEGYRGQGIYSKLSRHVYDEYKTVPSIKYEIFSTNNLNYEGKKESLNKSFKVLFTKSCLNYRFHPKDLNIPTPLPPAKQPQEVTSADMMALFATERDHPNLFPGGKIIIGFTPLRLLEANMRYIVSPDTYLLASKNEKYEVSLLTVSTSNPCQLGRRIILQIFGCDVTTLRHHILDHLLHIKPQSQTDVVLQMFCEERLKKALKEIAEELRLAEADLPIKEMISLERDFVS